MFRGVYTYIASIKSQSDNINLTRLNQDMRAMMDIMVRDIHRAGFATSHIDAISSLNNDFPALRNNPFFDAVSTGATTDVATYDPGTCTPNSPPNICAGSCIVYSYNINDTPLIANGIERPINSNERLGFRLNSTTNALEMRNGGTTNENCTDDADWVSITAQEVMITGLTFTLTTTTVNVTSMVTHADGNGCYDGDNNCNGLCDTGENCNYCQSGQACLYVRNVDIILSSSLTTDNTVTQTITEQVKVRNDKYLAVVP